MDTCPLLDMSSITSAFLLLTKDSALNLVTSHKIQNDPSWAHLNWIEGHNWVQLKVFNTNQRSLPQVAITACFEFVKRNSSLTHLAGLGRASLKESLTKDELQVFNCANLFEELARESVYQWWDYFRTQHYSRRNELNLKQGRLAEYWTMLFEKKYLQTNNLSENPIWVSLEGDYFGYDIKSFRKREKSKYYDTILIEVKSFISEASPVIYITKNEWSNAVKSKSIYFFHVWCIENKGYHIFSTEELINHIPTNNKEGSWESVSINLGHLWAGKTYSGFEIL